MTDVDSETVTIWGDAMIAALRGDRSELVEMLRYDNKVTRDLAEFLAWLLDKKPGHRPPLPAKFKTLDQWARNPDLWDAAMDFERQRAHWYGMGRAGGPMPIGVMPLNTTNKKRFPFKAKLQEVADRYGVRSDTLENALRRTRKSGKRYGG